MWAKSTHSRAVDPVISVGKKLPENLLFIIVLERHKGEAAPQALGRSAFLLYAEATAP